MGNDITRNVNGLYGGLIMIKVVGVRFKKAGKIYYFNPVDMNIEKNTFGCNNFWFKASCELSELDFLLNF